MSTRMDIVSLPEPPNKKSSDYLDAMRGWVYIAVKAIAQEVAKIELVLYRKRGGKVDVVEEHEALDILDRVNDFQTKYDFLEGTQVFLELVGEAFWFKAKPKNGGTPKELWLLRPDWIEILPPKKKGEFIGGFRYRVPGGNAVDYDVGDVVHFKYFNPKNPYRGLGPLQAAAYAYDTDFFATRWNRNFFYNNAMPSIILKTEQSLKEKEIKRIKSEWRNAFGGVNNAHKFALLTGGLDIDTALKQTFRDMEFLNLRRFSRDEIFTIFQVPKTIVAITEDVNRANAEEHRAVWFENVIKPKMAKLVAFLNEFYLPDWGDDLYFGFKDPTPDSVETNLKIVREAADVLTVNERRELLGYEPIPEGNVIRVPFSLMSENVAGAKDFKATVKEIKKKDKVVVSHKRTPFEMLKTKIKEELEKSGIRDQIKDLYLLISKKYEKFEKKEDEEENKEEVIHVPEGKRNAFWKQMVRRSESQEEEFKKILKKFWRRQKREVLSNIEGVKMFSRVKNVDRYLFDIEKENDILVELVNPLLREIVAQAGDEALALLGIGEEFKFTEEVIEAVDNFGLFFAESVNTTTYEKLKNVIQEGIANNESIPKISERVRDVFEEADKSRSVTIARTETIRANNLGHLEGYKQSGIVHAKEWMVALDERTCEFCLQMEKEYSVRGLDEEFLTKGSILRGVNGGEMVIDYSDLQAPPLHPRCRCVVLPVIKVGRGFSEVYEKRVSELEELERLEKDRQELENKLAELEEKRKEVEKEIDRFKEERMKEVEKDAKRILSIKIKEAEKEKEEIIKEAEKIRDEYRKRLYE